MKNCIYCGKSLDGETVCPRCGKKILEYRALEDLPYQAAPTALAEEIAQAKVGLLSRGDAKKLAEAARNGQVQTTEAVVDEVSTYTESSGDDFETEYTVANLSDPEGRPAPRSVQVLGKAPQAGETVVLFRYLKKKTWSYAVLTKADYADFPAHLNALFTLSSDGTHSRVLPTMEGSVGDKLGGLLGGLFSKKGK